MAKAFKALSNPNRLQIYLEIIDQRGKRVKGQLGSGCGISACIRRLNIGAPTVSHHVKELVNADLIKVERKGKYMTCFLNDSMYDDLGGFFDGESLFCGKGLLSKSK
ncbi:MAG: transcriptional regulator [Moraxellaceae bacterium]|nr:MAG: transcriptional regulator [Moraxellaceae bacterium]